MLIDQKQTDVINYFIFSVAYLIIPKTLIRNSPKIGGVYRVINMTNYIHFRANLNVLVAVLEGFDLLVMVIEQLYKIPGVNKGVTISVLGIIVEMFFSSRIDD
jgi:hypothetical protein